MYSNEEPEEEIYYNNYINPRPSFSPQLYWFSKEEEDELSILLSKELEIENNELPAPVAASRREAVDWVLNVSGHHSFSASTAVLAVNYLDRFLYEFRHRTEKPWMAHLAAVASLSIAAKIEETHVPFLLDLQVEEAKYIFEAKTIQRMEILVLFTLQWRMNPVTPLSFLHYFIRRLGLKNQIFWEFLKRCECLLLSMISDCRLMQYLPSVIASATMLHVINGVEEYQTPLLSILGIDKDKVEDCCKLIQEIGSRRLSLQLFNKRKLGSSPDSPKGIVDVSFSSDKNDLSSPLPPKRIRAPHRHLD